MRIWHEKLIPCLCQKHLCAMWREGNIMFYGILENKHGWKNHPARKEFEMCPDKLWCRLLLVRNEMLKRGYHPREMMTKPNETSYFPVEWQSLDEQHKVLKEKRQTIKSCRCKIYY